MKKTQLCFLSNVKTWRITTFMFLFCWMLGFGAYAQSSSTTITNSSDPVNDYLEKHKDSPLVRQYQQSPDDQEINLALRLSVILDNPGQFPEFMQTDLDRMDQELNEHLELVNAVDQQMKTGVSYDMAKTTYQRKMKLLESQQPTPVQNERSEPALSAPVN